MEIWVIFHSMNEKNVSNDLRFLNIQYAHKCQYFTEFTDIIICLEPSISSLFSYAFNIYNIQYLNLNILAEWSSVIFVALY